MSNIHNFANRQLCEYASIFPTVASLLDHLLFTVGNGYDFNDSTGMITDEKNCRIDKYPTLSANSWAKLIAGGHAKELKWLTRRAELDGECVDIEVLAENCKKYKIVNLDDSAFTEDAIYADLLEARGSKKDDEFAMDRYHRPYPLSESYSDVYNLNQNTPKWFVQIALNFCKAWIRFLNEAIENNEVWIKPSLRPKTEKSLARAAGMNALFDLIKADPTYDGWADKTKEAESDYADLTWTTRHRDMLAEQVQRLEGLLRG